jgi:4-amino-4-deoxy-L-arabinose transferase-like glycosyltransferase
MILVTLILLSCLGLGWAMRDEIRGPSRALVLILAGLASGLAVITKGPYGVMFPLFFLVLAPLRHRELKRPHWGMAWFGLSIAVVVGMWVLAAYSRDGGKYLHDVLHQPDLTTTDTARKGFFWYAAPLLVHTLPISLFLPLAVGKWRREGFSASLCVAAVILLVLCFFPKKRNHYLLPLYPFLALGIAEGIWHYGQRRRQWLRVAMIAISLAIIGGPLYFGLILPWRRPAGDPELSFLTEVSKRLAPASLVVCDSGMDEELAWVRRKYQDIETVTNVEHAAKALQAAAKGTDVVARKLFFTTLTNAQYRLPLEPIFEQSLGHKGPWYLLRYGD